MLSDDQGISRVLGWLSVGYVSVERTVIKDTYSGVYTDVPVYRYLDFGSMSTIDLAFID